MSEYEPPRGGEKLSRKPTAEEREFERRWEQAWIDQVKKEQGA